MEVKAEASGEDNTLYSSFWCGKKSGEGEDEMEESAFVVSCSWQDARERQYKLSLCSLGITGENETVEKCEVGVQVIVLGSAFNTGRGNPWLSVEMGGLVMVH